MPNNQTTYQWDDLFQISETFPTQHLDWLLSEMLLKEQLSQHKHQRFAELAKALSLVPADYCWPTATVGIDENNRRSFGTNYSEILCKIRNPRKVLILGY